MASVADSASPNSFLEGSTHLKDVPSNALSSDSIPVIDFSALNHPDQRSKTIHDLAKACEEWGFFILVNHGMPEELMDSTFRGLKEFVNLPNEVKKQYKGKSPLNPISFRTFNSAESNMEDTLCSNNLILHVHPNFHCPDKPHFLRHAPPLASRRDRASDMAAMRLQLDTIVAEMEALRTDHAIAIRRLTALGIPALQHNPDPRPDDRLLQRADRPPRRNTHGHHFLCLPPELQIHEEPISMFPPFAAADDSADLPVQINCTWESGSRLDSQEFFDGFDGEEEYDSFPVFDSYSEVDITDNHETFPIFDVYSDIDFEKEYCDVEIDTDYNSSPLFDVYDDIEEGDEGEKIELVDVSLESIESHGILKHDLSALDDYSHTGLLVDEVFEDKNGLGDDGVPEEIKDTAYATTKPIYAPLDIQDMTVEQIHNEVPISDGDNDGMIFGGSEASTTFFEEWEQEFDGDSYMSNVVPSTYSFLFGGHLCTPWKDPEWLGGGSGDETGTDSRANRLSVGENDGDET